MFSQIQKHGKKYSLRFKSTEKNSHLDSKARKKIDNELDFKARKKCTLKFKSTEKMHLDSKARKKIDNELDSKARKKMHT